MIEKYQDDYPEGSAKPRLQCTRERWIRGNFGTPDHQEISISHLLVRDQSNLLARGTARALNKEFRLSNSFIHRELDPPPAQGFVGKKDSARLVRKKEAFWVQTNVGWKKTQLDPIFALQAIVPR